jgi:ATP-dependent Clp protease ATP-binding subunit ClpA
VESQECETTLRLKSLEEAARALVDVFQVYRAEMRAEGRPVGNYLFLGPTGSGKTRNVEATAEVLFGDPHAVIKVDCAVLSETDCFLESNGSISPTRAGGKD